MKDNIAMMGELCGETPAGQALEHDRRPGTDHAPDREGNNGMQLPAGQSVMMQAKDCGSPRSGRKR